MVGSAPCQSAARRQEGLTAPPGDPLPQAQEQPRDRNGPNSTSVPRGAVSALESSFDPLAECPGYWGAQAPLSARDRPCTALKRGSQGRAHGDRLDFGGRGAQQNAGSGIIWST